MLKWELGNSLVRHENVLKEEHKLPVDVRGSKTSVLKLSINKIEIPTSFPGSLILPPVRLLLELAKVKHTARMLANAHKDHSTPLLSVCSEQSCWEKVKCQSWWTIHTDWLCEWWTLDRGVVWLSTWASLVSRICLICKRKLLQSFYPVFVISGMCAFAFSKILLHSSLSWIGQVVNAAFGRSEFKLESMLVDEGARLLSFLHCLALM